MCGQHRSDDHPEHLAEIVLAKRWPAAPDPPDVHLMWLSHVMAVDDIPAVAHARHAEHDITGRAGMRAQHLPVPEIAGIAAVSRDSITGVAQPVVVGR